MANLKWNDAVKSLNATFPILPSSAELPSIDKALDDGVDDLLRESLAQPSPVNQHYAEELLQDCINRISNCLLLRDKAQDIELRAIGEALTYKAQVAAVDAQSAVNAMMETMAPTMAQNATKVKTDAGAYSFEGNSETWGKIAATHEKLYAELREGLEFQRLKATTEGNGSNFVERFAFLKRLFDLNIVEAYRRAIVCAKSLKSIYGITVDVPKILPNGYLNELSIWAQRASDALDEELDRRLFGEVAFAVAGLTDTLKDYELIPRTRYDSEIASTKVSFQLTSAHFERAQMTDPLLRSLRVQVKAKDEKLRFWPAQVVLPKSQVTQGVEIFPCVAPSLYQNPSDQDSVVRGVHNIRPLGNWEIRLADRATTGDDTNKTEVTNLYIFLRLSYRRI